LSPPNQVLEVASHLTGVSIGGCVGGSGYLGYGGTISACYYATPRGNPGFTFTTGHGWGTPQVSANYGVVSSNGQTLQDQNGGFTYVGLGADELYDSLAEGRTPCGQLINDVGFGVGAGPAPVSAEYGSSNTTTFQSFLP
jgi:hypothetical protein